VSTPDGAPAAVGGRVLDAGALVDLVEQRSIYTDALLTLALRTGIVLAVATTAAAAARAAVSTTGRARLHVLPDLPVCVVDLLDWETAEDAADLLATTEVPGADLAAAHTVRLALHRGWPVLTDRAGLLRAIAPGLDTDDLP